MACRSFPDLEFKVVDRIAQDLLKKRNATFDPFDKERVLGAVNGVLHEQACNGHCGASFIKIRNLLPRWSCVHR
jgi:hypothetical protein